ncbi:hypothetical protein C8R43DRAFT_958065 [Mycena crocata]|nr:hypothetical protein C8R43DRAFT_958065 [Mycena crocata]
MTSTKGGAVDRVLLQSWPEAVVASRCEAWLGCFLKHPSSFLKHFEAETSTSPLHTCGDLESRRSMWRLEVNVEKAVGDKRGWVGGGDREMVVVWKKEIICACPKTYLLCTQKPYPPSKQQNPTYMAPTVRKMIKVHPKIVAAVVVDLSEESYNTSTWVKFLMLSKDIKLTNQTTEVQSVLSDSIKSITVCAILVDAYPPIKSTGSFAKPQMLKYT